MSHLEKLYAEKEILEGMCKNLVETSDGNPRDSDLWLLHRYTESLSAINMLMDDELYKQSYEKTLDNRTRQIKSRLEFIKKLKANAKIIRHAQKKFAKEEKGLSRNTDKILDGTDVVNFCDGCLDEIFNDSKNIYDESKTEGISASLLPKHVGVWDKTKATYINSIQPNTYTEGPESNILSHMIDSGQISLPTPPDSSLQL